LAHNAKLATVIAGREIPLLYPLISLHVLLLACCCWHASVIAEWLIMMMMMIAEWLNLPQATRHAWP
jgi:hypothetical protein